MTNEDIFRIALLQSSYDCNCNPEDFLSKENKTVLSRKNEKARAYLPLSFECDLISYGNNIIAQVSQRTKETVEILKRGKVPFYCAAWSNIKSVRNAVKCGFRPGWVELTARDSEFVDGMNR